MKGFHLAFITIFIFSFSSCKSQQPNPKVWTKEYEHGWYNYLDSVSKLTMPDADKRSKYIAYIISRLKEEIPNGAKSVSRDSLSNLNYRIGREYAFKLHNEGKDSGLIPSYVNWTPKIEKALRDTYFVLLKNTSNENKGKFCDCVIKKLKRIYPDSILVPTPREIMIKVNVECKKLVEVN